MGRHAVVLADTFASALCRHSNDAAGMAPPQPHPERRPSAPDDVIVRRLRNKERTPPPPLAPTFIRTCDESRCAGGVPRLARGAPATPSALRLLPLPCAVVGAWTGVSLFTLSSSIRYLLLLLGCCCV